jgi:type I restriction enzyme R subunit
MEDNEDIFVRLMNDDNFREMAAQYLMRTVYQQINQDAE